MRIFEFKHCFFAYLLQRDESGTECEGGRRRAWVGVPKWFKAMSHILMNTVENVDIEAEGALCLLLTRCSVTVDGDNA